jgi:hypothetical protein
MKEETKEGERLELVGLKKRGTREGNKFILALMLRVEDNQNYDQNVIRNYYIT